MLIAAITTTGRYLRVGPAIFHIEVMMLDKMIASLLWILLNVRREIDKHQVGTLDV